MPVRRTSQNGGQSTVQPNGLHSYSNDIFWGSELQPGDTHEESMFPSNDNYELFQSNYNANLEQVLNSEMYGEANETHNMGYLESSATAIYPSFVPTPLPTALGTGFLPLGEPPSEGGGANWPSNWESEEVDVDLSMRFHELQLEIPIPSTSNSTAGRREPEPRKPRKKEESGVCSQCSQTFSRKSDVRRHENTAHGREIHACPMCNTICSRKDALRRHIRDQH